jgi:hypothetical protein
VCASNLEGAGAVSGCTMETLRCLIELDIEIGRKVAQRRHLLRSHHETVRDDGTRIERILIELHGCRSGISALGLAKYTTLCQQTSATILIHRSADGVLNGILVVREEACLT